MSELDPDYAAAQLAAYFGLTPGGEDLAGAVARLPLDRIGAVAQGLAKARRVFIAGNGGSHDNARILSSLLRQSGLATVPLGPIEMHWEVGLESGFEDVFAADLRRHAVGPDDALLCLSGSGNSPNIVRALEQADAAGAAGYALGGRDGGAMVRATGPARAVIVPSPVMEVIEDLHAVTGHLLATSLVGGAHAPLAATGVELLALARRHLPQLAELAAAVAGTLFTGGRVLIVGLSPGTSHWRQDLERGSTNTLPITGLHAPELLTAGSLSASANDDGFATIFTRGLAKLDAGPKDVAILCGATPPVESVADAVRNRGCSVWSFGAIRAGATSVPLLPDPRFVDVTLSIVNHALSRTLNAWLTRALDVQAIEIPPLALPPDRRRPDERQLADLEAALHRGGHLAPDRVLAFAYGRAFSALHPRAIGLARSFV